VRWRGASRVVARRRCSRGREHVGTPKSAARTRGETSGAKRVYGPRRYPRPDARRLYHGEVEAGVRGDRHEEPGARGRRRRVCVRGWRREHARGPKARPLHRTRACAKATRVAKATAARRAGQRGSVRGGGAKGSTSPPKRRALVHGHAGVCEGAHVRMLRSRPWWQP
jgi:hypothetical protein